MADPVVLLTAYLAGMSASSIAFLPGGFGVIEVAMIAALHAGGVLTTPATAAVLLYRMISCVCVVAAGWAVWSCTALTRLHHLMRNAQSAASCPTPSAPSRLLSTTPPMSLSQEGGSMIAPTATSPGLGAVTAVAPLSTRSAQRPHLTPAGATEQSNDPRL